MSFDGLVTYSVVSEMKNTIVGGRIDKIYQLNSTELIITVRNEGKNYKILISANSARARISLTEKKFDTPSHPPMFCMLLRKHIQGGLITDIKQKGLDRIVAIDVKTYDDLGDLSIKSLIIEIMGKHSNIILLDNNRIIIDSIKRVYSDISSVREVLPTYNYVFPPFKEKLDVRNFTYENLTESFSEIEQNSKLKQALIVTFEGLGPLIAEEISFVSGLDSNLIISMLSDEEFMSLFESIVSLGKRLNEYVFEPVIKYKNDMKIEVQAFYCFKLAIFESENIRIFSSISECLEECFEARDQYDVISQKTHDIRKSVTNTIQKLGKKLQKQKEELLQSKEREILKIYGDLLSSNQHIKSESLSSIKLSNYYDPDMKEITIPLNEKLSLSKNAQAYYKKYSKLKNRENLLSVEIPKVELELEYLEHVLLSLENITTASEVDEVKEELHATGYLENNTKQKKKKISSSKPLEFLSSDGYKIYVGKNNKQNDELTFKIANSEDIWMHVQKMPGSHVIIKTSNEFPPDSTIKEAAVLAKYYSRAKNASDAYIDYTKRKNVKRIKGGNPGMVNYRDFETYFIKPDEKEVHEIIGKALSEDKND